MRAHQFILEAKLIDDSIIKRAMDANMSKVMKNAALKSIPYAGPLMGLYFAYDRYQSRPSDYIGMALEVATGISGTLGGTLLGISVIVARDCYYTVVQLLKNQPLPEPEYLKLSGNLEDDMDQYPDVVVQIRKQLQVEIEKKLKETAAKAKEIEAQSKLDRNLAPAEYDSGPLKGWSHPQTVKAFNQRSKTGREYK
jgi:hypothetical protein